jgi:hypothetical protein
MSPGNGLAILDCAACGCPLFQHVLPRELLADEINLIEDWGPLPACLTKHRESKPPGFGYCPCPGYQMPLVFSYAQMLELLGVMGARNPELALSAVRERNHKPTGRPRGRPRKTEQTTLVLS